MKHLTLLIAPIFVFASQTITPMEQSSIHGYNKNPTLKMKTEQKKRNLSNYKDEEIRQIVKKETSEDVLKLKLTQSGNYLVYKAITKSYRVQVNALDGTIMKKELKK
jgi:uncharacterized membrane protein YkoI